MKLPHNPPHFASSLTPRLFLALCECPYFSQFFRYVDSGHPGFIITHMHALHIDKIVVHFGLVIVIVRHGLHLEQIA